LCSSEKEGGKEKNRRKDEGNFPRLPSTNTQGNTFFVLAGLNHPTRGGEVGKKARKQKKRGVEHSTYR
jgi:hypothetical protein